MEIKRFFTLSNIFTLIGIIAGVFGFVFGFFETLTYIALAVSAAGVLFASKAKKKSALADGNPTKFAITGHVIAVCGLVFAIIGFVSILINQLFVSDLVEELLDDLLDAIR